MSNWRSRMNSNDENDWKKKILELDEEYDLNKFLAYRELPVSKKLEYLEEMTELFNKLTPKENKIAWENIKEEGF